MKAPYAHKIDKIVNLIDQKNSFYKRVWLVTDSKLTNENNLMMADVTPDEADFKINDGITMDSFWDGNLCSVHTYVEPSLKELRGYKILTGRNFFAFLGNGRESKHPLHFSYHEGKYYFDKLPNGKDTDEHMKQVLIFGLSLVIQKRLLSDCIWTCSIKNTNGSELVLPTHPEISRKVFKDREVPEGKERRPMIKNFISEHIRYYESGKEAKIQEHKRGSTVFNWNEYTVTINPPKENYTLG